MFTRPRLSLLAIAFCIASVGCSNGTPSSCVPGASAACSCTDGRSGAQTCLSDRTFGTCVCEATDAGSPQVDATADARTDVGTQPDTRDSGGTPDATCPKVETEWCDGVDNDCNGLTDDGEVCPDNTVANTDSFTDGVYLLGTTAEGSCGADALQRFWPTLASTYLSGFDCYADTYTFRRTDGTVFYTATFAGLYQDVAGSADTLVQTPPCGSSVDSYTGNPTFGFDGTGALYYQCSDTVRKGNGVLVAQSVQRLAGVLADGRTIVLRASSSAMDSSDFVVLDQSGAEISRLDPRPGFVGTMSPLTVATTVANNRAYVAFQRTYGQQQKEIVAFRLTEASVWQRMRRVPVTTVGSWALVISDGTVFIRENDPTTTFDQRIRALKPNGTDVIVWREADQTTVRAHIGDQLLVGPM